VTHDLASVTVFHEECMHADALATVLTVLGPQQGMDLPWHSMCSRRAHTASAHPQGNGAAAGRMLLTPGPGSTLLEA
jgi:thiamine biosynthesis lipoprotein